jgi:hypothetical protein
VLLARCRRPAWSVLLALGSSPSRRSCSARLPRALRHLAGTARRPCVGPGRTRSLPARRSRARCRRSHEAVPGTARPLPHDRRRPPPRAARGSSRRRRSARGRRGRVSAVPDRVDLRHVAGPACAAAWRSADRDAGRLGARRGQPPGAVAPALRLPAAVLAYQPRHRDRHPAQRARRLGRPRHGACDGRSARRRTRRALRSAGAEPRRPL